MRTVIGRGMYGMWGPLTDPGEREFTAKVKALGVDVGHSPYRDYDVNEIAADFDDAPADAICLLWGSSLGANNCPVVASRTKHIIHGMWGFQASLGGEQRYGTPANVLFAHEVYNPNIWLGAFKWFKATGNTVTNQYLSERDDFHPGETESAQAMFLAEMQRIIARPVGERLDVAARGDYTAVANALIAKINAAIANLNGFEQSMIRNYLTPDRENVVAGQGAKVAVDALDAYRATKG